MGLADRIARLERAIGASNAGTCLTCGYPSRYGRGFTVANSVEDIPRCCECGNYVDETGFTLPQLGSNGRAWVKIRVMGPDPERETDSPTGLATREPGSRTGCS